MNYWYKEAIFYELNIRAFQDSTGNGQGDIPGLITRLDYLQWLGVDCIWLLPMYPSPRKDDGYDISDFKDINPEYGTLDDFKLLIHEVHKRGMRLIADLVLNHTSDQHEWFQRAVEEGEGSEYFDYYTWSDDPTKFSDARIIFIDTESSNWTYHPKVKKYYWHRFFSHQPDLNYDNPKVQEEMLDIIKFWLDLGIDGFRADAVPYLFVREGTNGENLPETHAYLKKLRKFVDENYEDKILLAEANQWPSDLRPYFGEGDEFHMAFNFPLMPRMFMAIQQGHHGPIVDIVKQIPDIPDNCQWCIFLRNHDELTLEMVTDQERDYMYDQYATEPRMKLNLGIRRRLLPLLNKDMRKVKLLYAMLLTLPGSPIIYYGDEIGMGDNIFLGDRDGVRTPMQWNENSNAGFSTCNPSRLYAPVSIDPAYNYHAVNVDAQKSLSSSLLNWLREFIQVRKRYSLLSYGKLKFYYPDNKSILVFYVEKDNSYMLCVFNMSGSAQAAEISMPNFNGLTPFEIFGDTVFPRIGELPYLLTFSPYGYYIFDLRLDHELPDEPSHDEDWISENG